MAGPIRTAGEKFNATQAKQVHIAAPRLELGREMSMPVGGGIMDPQSSPPIPTQGQQGFMGSRQGAGAAARFTPMGGARPQPLQPQPQPQPQYQPQPTQLAGGDEEHVVEVYGVAPDGTELVSTFGAVFPRGTRIMGVSGLPPGARIFTPQG